MRKFKGITDKNWQKNIFSSQILETQEPVLQLILFLVGIARYWWQYTNKQGYRNSLQANSETCRLNTGQDG